MLQKSVGPRVWVCDLCLGYLPTVGVLAMKTVAYTGSWGAGQNGTGLASHIAVARWMGL